MKLKKDFVLHLAGDESFLVPVGGTEFAGVVQGNAFFGEILSLLQTDTDVTELVDTLFARIDAPREKLQADAERVITELRKIGALEE